MGGFDPWAKPWGMDGIPDGLLVRDAAGGLGQVRDPDAQRAGARCPRSRPRRCAAPERARELHARQLLHPRRGARGAAATTWARASARAASPPRAARARRWRSGSSTDRAPMDLWSADIRRFAPFHGEPALPARAGQRDAWASTTSWPSRTASSPAGAGCAGRRCTSGSRRPARLLRRQDGLGARQLVRARGRRAGDGVLLRPPELVPVRGGRAPRGPRGGGAVRPDLVRQAPARGRGRRGGPRSGSAPTTWRCRPAASSTPRMLNERGGFESDLTVTRLADDAYLIVTGAAQGTRDARLDPPPPAARARAPPLTDVTGASAVLGLMGPRSRDAARAPDRRRPAATDAFPFVTSREIAVGQAPVRASRITYVGELGWELYVPVGVRRPRLRRAGGGGPRTWACATRATTRSTRSAWRRRIGRGAASSPPTTRRWRPGLGFAVRLDKPGRFLGRDALLAPAGRGR